MTENKNIEQHSTAISRRAPAAAGAEEPRQGPVVQGNTAVAVVLRSHSSKLAIPMLAVFAALLLAASAHAAVDADRIVKLPGWEKALPSPQYSGFLDAGGGKHLHYWLAQSEGKTSGAPSKDPLVFWFNGSFNFIPCSMHRSVSTNHLAFQ